VRRAGATSEIQAQTLTHSLHFGGSKANYLLLPSSKKTGGG